MLNFGGVIEQLFGYFKGWQANPKKYPQQARISSPKNDAKKTQGKFFVVKKTTWKLVVFLFVGSKTLGSLRIQNPP